MKIQRNAKVNAAWEDPYAPPASYLSKYYGDDNYVDAEPETIEYEFEFELDADISIDKEGNWEWLDDSEDVVPNANGDVVMEEEPYFVIEDTDSIIWDVDDILGPYLPYEAGKYHISGAVKLVYTITYVDEDSRFADDIDFVAAKSSINNFEFTLI